MNEDDLRDLSPEDALELKAFLEKRRWFEGKLKLLEEIPPIYPFVHPALSAPIGVDDSPAPQYAANPAEGNWKLPTVEKIKSWQAERISLEEEILAFDGGDLSRMKQKTRAATLLPLTPSSTHLVSITLELIVIVDRLMKLLRHRADLLELISIRLEWDQLRWQIMMETSRVRAEIDSIARDRGRWVAPASETWRAATLEKDETQTPTQRSSALPSSSSVSSALSDISDSSHSPAKRSVMSKTKRDSVSSISSFVNSPKRTLHLPLLHSSIVTLEIRQKNLTSTTLARSGKLLDKMIDLAIPLRNLGGVDGPETGSEGGAVPDELLDIQDDLENEAKELKKRISWCKELEEQWRQADAHYLASTKALEAAVTLTDQLSSTINAPASPTTQIDLSRGLDEGRALLPPSIGPTFPRPSHSAFPAYDEHTRQLISVLQKRREEADVALIQCGQDIEWYLQLAQSSATIAEMRVQLETLNRHLTAEINLLKYGEEEQKPPTWDKLEDADLQNGWEGLVTQGISRAKSLLSQSLETNQRITVKMIQFRKHIRNMPKFLPDMDNNGFLTDSLDQANLVSDATANLVDKARSVISLAENDLALVSAVASILSTSKSLSGEIDHIRSAINWNEDDAINLTAIKSLSGRTRIVRESHSRDLVIRIKVVYNLLKEQGRVLPAATDHLEKESSAIRSDLLDLERALELFQTIADQQTAVQNVELGADQLLGRIRDAQQSVQSLRDAQNEEDLPLRVPDELTAATSSLVAETEQWLAGIPAKIPFVSASRVSSASPSHSEGIPGGGHPLQPLLPPNSSTSAPPFTPPATPPPIANPPGHSGMLLGQRGGRPDAEAELADEKTRKRVNETAGRVKSHLASLKEAASTIVSDLWRRRLVDICRQAEVSLDQFETTMAKFEDDLQRFDAVFAKERDAVDLATVKKDVDAFETSWTVGDQKVDLATLTASHEAVLKRFDQVDDCDKDKLTREIEALRTVIQRTAELQQRATALTVVNEDIRGRLTRSLQERVSHTVSPSAISNGKPRTTDVFGVVSEVVSKHVSITNDAEVTADSLSARLSSLDLPSVLFGAPSLHKSAISQQIPTSPIARRIQEELRAILDGLRFLQESRDVAADENERLVALDTSLSAAHAELPRLDKLVAISQAVKACDEAFSRLLDLVDSYHNDQEDALRSQRQLAQSVLEKLRLVAEAASDDPRVVAEVKKTDTSWAELDGLVEETLHPDTASVRSIDTVSEVSSIASRSTTFHRQALSRAGMRNASGPSGQPPQLAPEPRRRAASDTPTRMRIESMKSGLPRLRKTSMGPTRPFATPTAPSPRTGVSSIPRPARSSLSNSKTGLTPTSKAAFHTAPRPRMSSRPSLGSLSSSLTGPHKAYVADPKSRLDMAVGKIVNKLKVDVPIRPVGLDTEEWKDQSGKYWIGAEGRARLCFCRILRSKTVMVRVGGGWVELSKFLMDHFADSLVGWDPTSSGPARIGIEIGSSTPVPITSASLSTPLRPRTHALPSSSTKLVPAAADGSSRNGSRDLLTPARATPNAHHAFSTVTPAQNAASPAGSATPTSPLVPLHFMRKASESPPVRQREKETLGLGRRSILGKSPSGNVMADMSPTKDTC